MSGSRWCPLCEGAKSPGEQVCLACGITRKACPYCGTPAVDHNTEETAYCTRQAAAAARLAESTTATLEGTS